MTRKPIFIGVATILALALTAGLAYGAGRMVSTKGYANQTGRPGSVAVVPRSSWGSANGYPQAGTAYRDQMRRWMQKRFGPWMNHAAVAVNRWANRGRSYGSTGATSGGTTYEGGGSNYQGNGYQNHSGYHPDDHWGSGSWGGGSDAHHGDCWGR